MEDTIRQLIVDDFKKRMQSITKLNGYHHDMGSNIFVYRTEDWQVSELPGGDIRDGDESVEVSGDHHVFTLDIKFEAKISGTTSLRGVRKVIADVTKAVGATPKFSDLIVTVRPVSNEAPEFNKKDKLFCSVAMNFEIIYITRAFDPYNVI